MKGVIFLGEKIRRTKIICTIGPASEELAVLEQLLREGMNVARLNFSHGTHEEHKIRIDSIRKSSELLGIPIAIMLDTKGPEIRIGLLENGKVLLKEGDSLTLTTEEILGTREKIFVNYSGLPKDVQEGTTILLDDGLISLKVERVAGHDIHCIIENGGELTNRKKLNIPNASINLPGLTDRDLADIEFGIAEGVDFIAASFIRSALDVLAIRRILEERNSAIDIISKIENRQGVDNIDEILKVSDGIMVARGDLGVEIPAEEVPIVQKMLIDKCNLAGKPVITATQMLESMTKNPRPTRAEASDVANAIYDGSDAIMLSGETASGRYPVEAVKTMARIALKIEESLNWAAMSKNRATTVKRSTTEAISHATSATALSLGAAAIITSTKSGSTAKMVSKYRPQAPIIAVTPDESVARKLLLVWGVQTLISPESGSTDDLIETAVNTSLQAGFIKNGDLVVITAGVPVGIPGSTNLIKVHTVGQILAHGMGIGRHSVSGRVVIANNAEQARENMHKGDILVAVSIEREFLPAVELASALITEEGGLTSPGAIVGINMGIPVIVGVNKVTELITNGQIVTIDPVRGLVYQGYAKVL